MNSELEPGPWEKIHRELGVAAPAFDDRPLGTYIESYAESIPDKTAIRFHDHEINYSELNKLANRLANALVALGIERHDVIGVQMPMIPQYAIAVLAASKIGAALSSVSPLLAPPEIVRQLEDANIKVLLSSDSLANSSLLAIERFPDCVSSVVITSTDDLRQTDELQLPDLPGVACHTYPGITAEASSSYHQVELPADHTLFVQYTGGTTGPAKGALLTLRSFTHTATLTQIYRPWTIGEETAVNAAPLSHIAGMLMLGITLKNGGRFVMIPDPRDMDHFCQQLIDCPPTRVGAVPTMYQMIVDHPLSARIDFSKLKFAITGAAPTTGNDRARVERMLQGTVLSDTYGMTETGPTTVVNPPARCKPEAMGIPLPGIDVRIVDVETGTRELPYGEAGEIIACSPAVMKGYLNRPDETAKALREWKGKTWMYTGDVGVMDEDGYVYMKDRTKDMLIVNGFKVFSVEVENELASLDCVAMSALIGSPDEQRSGSEVVNLYVQLTEQAKQRDADEVREEILVFCRDNLAKYKVPKNIQLIDAIPLTGAGKVDKKILRAHATT